MTEGSYWFRRLVREAKKISPHLKFFKIKYGFYRIYWTGGGPEAYVHEVYKEMPEHGYDIEEKDIRLISQRYYEEYEDQFELTRKVKNFVEGYWESLETLKKRVYMLKNNKEFNKNSVDAYKQIRVK